MDRLEETGQIYNTIIVLWSDYGWQFGEKLAFRKFTLWERALRVPLMIAGPGVVKGESREPISLLDLYPILSPDLGTMTRLQFILNMQEKNQNFDDGNFPGGEKMILRNGETYLFPQCVSN